MGYPTPMLDMVRRHARSQQPSWPGYPHRLGYRGAQRPIESKRYTKIPLTLSTTWLDSTKDNRRGLGVFRRDWSYDLPKVAATVRRFWGSGSRRANPIQVQAKKPHVSPEMLSLHGVGRGKNWGITLVQSLCDGDGSTRSTDLDPCVEHRQARHTRHGKCRKHNVTVLKIRLE